MALWGTADSLYSIGTVEVDYDNKEVIGSGTSFTAVGISTGDIITIGTFGSAVISGITSDLLISIATTQYLTGAAISGVAYSISEKPSYTLNDSNYSSNILGLTTTVPKHGVYGIDIYETGLLAPGASGLSTQYGGFHAGWVGIHTYIDTDGNLRVKTETLVASSSISGGTFPTYTSVGDANDDNIFADAVITIAALEDVVGIGTDEDAIFVADVTVVPSYAPLDYQWYEDATPLSDGGDYSGTSTTILTVANDSDKADGREYTVVVTSGDTTQTSTAATITYA